MKITKKEGTKNMSIKNLIEQLQEEDQTNPIVWQYYLPEHTAGYSVEQFTAMSEWLMTNPAFFEDSHIFFSAWFEAAYKQIQKEEGINN
jgi:hypothetical protein